MRLRTERLVIRDFELGDASPLHAIVNEPGVRRFMPDWSVMHPAPADFDGYIRWMQSKVDLTDLADNRRFEVCLPEDGRLIGMVGIGLEDTLNEIELAFFMCQAEQRKGYTREALQALVAWSFERSNLPYLILTIDCANEASAALASACGFELFERRTPISHKQPNMESDSYFYFRRYRS